jgi:hypothetical protein
MARCLQFRVGLLCSWQDAFPELNERQYPSMRSRSSLTQDGHGLFTLIKWRSFLAPRTEGYLPLQNGPLLTIEATCFLWTLILLCRHQVERRAAAVTDPSSLRPAGEKNRSGDIHTLIRGIGDCRRGAGYAKSLTFNRASGFFQNQEDDRGFYVCSGICIWGF